jgi:hypothetical protein
MASKSSGGGGFFWGLVGFLVGVAATLALLAYLSREPGRDYGDPLTAADEAAVEAQAPVDPALAPPAPAPEEAPVARAPNLPVDPSIDPVTDDQIADDAAATGMTTRAPPTPEVPY